MQFNLNKPTLFSSLVRMSQSSQPQATHADLPGFHYDLSNLINIVQKPDLVLVDSNARHLILLELSSCMEEYADSRHKEKLQRYERLVCALKSINYGVDFYAVEITARGIVSAEVFRLFKDLDATKNQIDTMIEGLIFSVLDCSRKYLMLGIIQSGRVMMIDFLYKYKG
ncbi:hypothetical protein RCL1_001608 [Eukaryota sp. TZLM3-RCL]